MWYNLYMSKNEIKIDDGAKAMGRYRFITYRAGTKEILRTSPWIKNLVMKGSNTGVNLIAQRLIGATTYDIAIDSAEIGTGNTAPANSDTNLQTPVAVGIVRANQLVASTNIATLFFFISDSDLPNGTYKEFGLRCGAQLFARSIISPDYTKASSEDTVVEYQITVANA